MLPKHRAMQRSLESFFRPMASKGAREKGKANPEPTKVDLETTPETKTEKTPEESPEIKPETQKLLENEPKRQKVETQTQPNVEPEKPTQQPTKQTPTQPQLEYLEIAQTFQKIENTTKRLEIVHYCSLLFSKVLANNPADLPKVTYLCVNRVGPDYEGLELGLGESLIIKALSESTGRSTQQVKLEYNKAGDLGSVALASKRNQASLLPPKPLSVRTVFDKLSEICRLSGQQSQSRKIAVIKSLLVCCRGDEAKYLVRSLEGKLRIGLAESSVLTALGSAFVNYDKSIGRKTLETQQAEEAIKEAFCQMPNYEAVISAATTGGVRNLASVIKLTPGIPLRPMLAKPTKSLGEVLDRFSGSRFTCEYKYDGERAQIHRTAEGKVTVYSRNMEDMSQRYPDILDIAPSIAAGNQDFILDCEAVAWDPVAHKILPFQVLSTRKRKDVDSSSITVQIHIFAFDLLYLNGESVIRRPLCERRDLLVKHFTPVIDRFSFATAKDFTDMEDIQHFLDQSIKDSCEGLMVKLCDTPESGYEPSKRSRNWLKLKKDYLDGLGDSLDLVVLGAYYGRGKRTNVYGGYLLGSYNPDSEEYETVCKIGTGFSEADLDKFYKQLSPLADAKPKSYISFSPSSNQQPDVWFEPKYVWEVLTADLSLSPVYRAGSSELGKGVSLRFPRFIREREDKGPEESTSSQMLIEFYERQARED